MEIELQNLDMRYETLRSREAKKERQLLGSLSQVGQLVPVVVVAGENNGRWILLDGYKRVRLLSILKQDTVQAMRWELPEADALLLERVMRQGQQDSALQQGWFLSELKNRFGLSQEELARRLDKTPSWVSRRLSLVRELPEVIQEQVRQGKIAAHTAQKYFVPLARANRADACQLSMAIAPLGLSTRQVQSIYRGYFSGGQKARELILTNPQVYLRAMESDSQVTPLKEKTPAALLCADFSAIGGIARRAHGRLKVGMYGGCGDKEQQLVQQAYQRADQEFRQMFACFEEEINHVG